MFNDIQIIGHIESIGGLREVITRNVIARVKGMPYNPITEELFIDYDGINLISSNLFYDILTEALGMRVTDLLDACILKQYSQKMHFIWYKYLRTNMYIGWRNIW